MSDDHIEDEKKFLKAFPEAVRISQFEFDALIFLYPERKVIQVADAGIEEEFEDEGAPDDDTETPAQWEKQKYPEALPWPKTKIYANGKAILSRLIISTGERQSSRRFIRR